MSADRIVVGVDFSGPSARAARWAAAEAVRRHVPLILLHSTALTESADVELDRLASSLRELHPDVDVTTRLTTLPAPQKLLDHDTPGTLIVVGASGMSALEQVFLGSVGRHVSQQASCPVVVVRGREHITGGPVVVGVDGSAVSADAVGFAFEEASLRQAALRVVHAWRGSGAGVDELAEDAQLTISETVGGWAEKFPDVQVDRRAFGGHPVDVLYGESMNAQLVVLGSHGRGRLARAVMGSVAHEAVSHALCPVAVVHPVAASADR